MRILIGIVYLLLALAAFTQEPPVREDGDFNFDGHQDYRLQSEAPGNQCGWWDYFIFDATSSAHRFVATSLCREQFDSENKLVKTTVSGGLAGMVYTTRHFRWEGFDLVVTYIEAQAYDREHDLFTLTRVTNLEARSGPTVSSEVITREEAEANAQAQF